VNSGGTLQLSGTGLDQIYSGVAVTVNTGGIFDANGLNEGMTSMTLNGNGSGSGALINSAASASFLTNTFPLGSATTIGGTGNLTLIGVVSGAFPLNYIGSGILTLNGASTFSGGLSVNAGKTITLANGAGAGTGTIAITGNGVLTCSVASTYANKITTTDTTGVVNVTAASGNIAFTGDLTGFSGKFNCNGGQTLINAANNQSFPISSAATWNIANGATLDLATPYVTDAANVIINGGGNNAFGCLRLDACNQTGPVTLNAANCTIGNGNAAASTISGVISDGGHGYGFTRTGTLNNTLILSAVNTYTGTTVNTNGTLEISGSIAGSVTVTGGTLQLDNATALPSTANLTLATTPAAGAVNLNYTGTQNINALYFGAALQAQGTWGSTTSSAANKNAAFTGNGLLNVATGSAVLSTNNDILSITNNGDGTFTMQMLGTPGAIYYMTSSGNVTNSMSAWTPVIGTTNTANGSGNWSTVVSNPAPVFYRAKAVNPHP
jgi:autotransporter-associated beta strand protein